MNATMFQIQAYPAEREVRIANIGGDVKREWQPCTVIGIDGRARNELRYLIEIETDDGEVYLDSVDYVRRAAVRG
ncbi:MAG: hypothetical protein WBA44_09550 [Mesorhizobium sp.]